MKNLINDLKKNITTSSENLENTKLYFCNKLHKISPGIANIKSVTVNSFSDYILNFEKLIKNMNDISVIYDTIEFYKIKKLLQNLNEENPSFLIKAIIEFNSFPKNENLLFYKTNYLEYFKNLFIKELKFKSIEKENEIFANMTNIAKELICHYLKNKSRQIRNIKYLFDSLAVMVIEANNREKEIRMKNKKIQKIGLTNFFIKQTLEEMFENINISFYNELYSNYELDHIFYFTESLLNYLLNHTHSICSKYAENIISDNDWIKNPNKSTFSYNQLLFLDQLVIYNGLKHIYKGLCLIVIYLKKAGLLKGKKYTEEEERIRITNRLANFKNIGFFFDFSYELFYSETKFELSEVYFFFFFFFFFK